MNVHVMYLPRVCMYVRVAARLLIIQATMYVCMYIGFEVDSF